VPSQPQVRPATPADLPAVAAIYAGFVRGSTATFDEDEPPLSTWQKKLDSTSPGDHFLVATRLVATRLVPTRLVATSPGASSPGATNSDGGGEVVGYAYSAAFRDRPAYARTRETSIYVAPEASGHGYGAMLYQELLNLLRADRIHLAVAVVAQPNAASDAIHRKLGFIEAGTLEEVGFKFGAYVSTTYFQMRLD
jgi:L-amino acid N-acyltransferase YncA